MAAILYARISTDLQSEQSITDQLRRCREKANAQGWPVTAEYVDQGISGAALGNRPGAQQALKSLQPGDVLIVIDTSRLSRSQDLAPLITRLRHRGIRVVGVLDGFDSDSQTARMQAGLSGIMSEEFRASISARVHSALDFRARGARPTGGRCFGFDAAGNVVESEAAIVREIYARAAAGETLKGLAADLNRRWIAAPGAGWNRTERRSDGRWMVSSIHSMLDNERYVGRVIWNKSTWKRDPDTGRRCRIERAESEWIVREGPAIVHRDLWDAVQARAKPRKLHGGRPGGGPKYLLSGILVCSVCGRRMIASGAKGAWYYCGTHRQGGDAACTNGVGTRRDVAEKVLLAPIYEQLLSDEAVGMATEMIQAWSRQERVTAAQPAEVEQIEGRIARLRAQVEAGTLEAEDVAETILMLNERRRALLTSAWKSAKRSPAVAIAAAQAAYRAAAADLCQRLNGESVIRARAALHELIGDVSCRPEQGVLVADFALNPSPLWKAAGIAQSGSGGLIRHQATLKY